MQIVKQGGRIDYNYKEIFLDTLDELSKVDKRDLCPGSIAYIIATGAVYILNSQGEWIAQ